MKHNVWKMCGAFCNKLFPHREGDKTRIFTDNEKMQGFTSGGCLFNEILMTEGKGICVHHKCTRLAVSACFFQASEITLESVTAVFHEDKCSVHACDLIKAQVTEKFCRSSFRVQKEMEIPTLILDFDQVRDDLV